MLHVAIWTVISSDGKILEGVHFVDLVVLKGSSIILGEGKVLIPPSLHTPELFKLELRH